MASQSTTDTETATTDADTTKAGTATTAADGTSPETTPGATTATEKAATEGGATTDGAADRTPVNATSEQPTTGSLATSASGSFVTGALALVGAGLGLVSLTGTSLGDMLRARQELLGQITAATGGQIDQIEALYGSPWSTVALVNGSFAVLAVILGAVLLATRARAAGTPDWVRAVALGGTVLGVIGLLVSAGMFFDLFAAAPTLPTLPGLGG